MELKVRVDGISRVVCGVSENTTCQQVVIALAQAMGRTGRFTLIEKWRDTERPLLPSDCPVKVLHKWGEYANEVQFLLHQTDKKVVSQTENLPKQVKAQENLVPSSNPVTKEKEVGLRRVLTFSGSHNTSVPSFQRQGGSARSRSRLINEHKSFEKIPESDLPPNSLSRDRGGVTGVLSSQNSGARENVDFHPAYRQDSSKTAYQGVREETLQPTQPAIRIRAREARHVRLDNNDVESVQSKTAPPEYQNVGPGTSIQYGRPNFDQELNNRDSHQSNEFSSRPSDHNHRLRRAEDKNRTLNNTQEKFAAPVSYEGHQSVRGEVQQRPHNKQWNERHTEIHTDARSHPQTSQNYSPEVPPTNPYNAKSPLLVQEHVLNDRSKSHSPFSQNRARASAFQPVQSNTPKYESDLPVINGDIDVPFYSGVPLTSTDVEEYDLDSNLPGVGHAGHTSAKQLLIEEYRMPGDGRHREQDVSSSDTTPTENPEVIRMKKLVNLQQDRIKAQEAQISSIDTDIQSLELEDREQTELLTKISDEIIDLNKTNHKYEVEVKELDATKWVDVIESEKTREKEMRVELEETKKKLTEKSDEIQVLSQKVVELEQEIAVEEVGYEEDVNRTNEEGKEVETELKRVADELAKENEKFDSDEKILGDIEKELEELGTRLEKQKEEMDDLEKELKEVNIEEFNLSPKETRKPRKSDSGEAVLKILEGRVSPAVGLNRKNIKSPLSKVLSQSKNPNGVWV